MNGLNRIRFLLLWSLAALLGLAVAGSQSAPATVKPPSFVRSGWPDHVNTVPRPRPNATNVSPYTTLYFELAPGQDAEGRPDAIDLSSLHVTLVRADGKRAVLIEPGLKWSNGATGRVVGVTQTALALESLSAEAAGLDPEVVQQFLAQANAGVYLVPPEPLDPATRYSVTIQCRSRAGQNLAPDGFGWKFTTAAAPTHDPVMLRGNVAKTVRWEGQIFAGICKPNFDTSRVFHQLDSYDLMSAASGPQAAPAVCSLQRDWPLCSDGWMNGFFDGNPNLVRERETRWIVAISDEADATVLTLDDLPEGPRFGIKPKRPLGADYAAGHEVLIADTAHSERSTILAVNEAACQVRVKRLARKAGEWKVAPRPFYPRDNPSTPDNFPHPGAYLRKFDPSGTPVYYWARLDHEWDLVHRQYGRRLVVNFEQTPCDLSADGIPSHPGGGGSPGPPKDWVQWHAFVRRVTSRLLQRYGEACYDFYWSIGNECDLRPTFWRSTDEMFLRWYDYTADAICRAFEDGGMDSARAKVGGIELGALAAQPPLLSLVLEHCSPRAGELGPLEKNFAFADQALAGERSRRVEELCAAHDGRGSPCDWISLHQYKLSGAAVRQLNWARRTALAIDPDFFQRLYVNSNESCPDWNPGRDPAAHAMYHGNGYLVAWCADWSARQIALAVADERFARHETLFTVWPFDYDLDGRNSLTALLHTDVDGDGKSDRVETVRKDILNYLECVGRMPREYFAISEAPAGPAVLGGFGARDEKHVYVLLYGHDSGDVETRGDRRFDATLRLDSFPFPAVDVEAFRIDAENNSYCRVAERLLAQGPVRVFTAAQVVALRQAASLTSQTPPVRAAVTSVGDGGKLALPVQLPANGVLLLVLTGRP